MDLYSSYHFLFLQSNAFSTRCRTAFAAASVDLLQVVAGSKCYVVGVIGRGGDGHCSRTTHVGVAQLIGKNLQFIRLEVAVIIQHVVMSWFASALYASVAKEVKIELRRMANLSIDNCPGRRISAFSSLIPGIFREESSMVALLNNNEGYLRLVTWVKLATCLLESL